MTKDLTSKKWAKVAEQIRKCHVSLVGVTTVDTADWVKAFEGLVDAIKDERIKNPDFAVELSNLTDDTGFAYDFADILEEYFDFLEDNEEWEAVVKSAETMIELFKWEDKMPSEYKFRIGNAYEKSGKYDEAEAFGQKWLDEYPQDLNAAAANVFLKVELKKFDEAEEITKKYLRDGLVCDENTDTFFMAAYRLYEMTDNINAKQRVEKKMAEYQAMVSK